jgi:hypothetical protein
VNRRAADADQTQGDTILGTHRALTCSLDDTVVLAAQPFENRPTPDPLAAGYCKAA